MLPLGVRLTITMAPHLLTGYIAPDFSALEANGQRFRIGKYKFNRRGRSDPTLNCEVRQREMIRWAEEEFGENEQAARPVLVSGQGASRSSVPSGVQSNPFCPATYHEVSNSPTHAVPIDTSPSLVPPTDIIHHHAGDNLSLRLKRVQAQTTDSGHPTAPVSTITSSPSLPPFQESVFSSLLSSPGSEMIHNSKIASAEKPQLTATAAPEHPKKWEQSSYWLRHQRPEYYEEKERREAMKEAQERHELQSAEEARDLAPRFKLASGIEAARRLREHMQDVIKHSSKLLLPPPASPV